jgi:hypothetical protein
MCDEARDAGETEGDTRSPRPRTDPRPGGSGPLDRAQAEDGDDQQRQAWDRRGVSLRRLQGRLASIRASLRITDVYKLFTVGTSAVYAAGQS